MDLLDKFLARLAGLPHKPLSMVTFGVGLVAVLYIAAGITWKLIPISESTVAWEPTRSAAQKGAQVNVSELNQLALFGRLDSNANKPKPKPVEVEITDAPKTSLSIQLTGVVASTAEQNGLAVIESRGSQETYSLGDKIKGTSASLKEVYADRIIITNSGRYETLMLDGLKYTSKSNANQQLQQAKSRPKVSRVDQRKNSRVAEQLSASREELIADPTKITDFIAISPVKRKGQILGYRLNPGKDAKLFQQAGFLRNDLAKSINGYDLTDMGQALEVMAQIPELTEISLMVERDEQLIEIMFSLPQ
ncbi:type II secretion system protein GspC [Shewanella gelidii]|uniref:Type II secretion system protein GspC n=1 Tax=Shewanella gelidii TaxID=1642821 RepID=A0A917JWF7_9GAMM|nr:type II secretion system protein GspC [Shewanella gelidii]MCL1098863.1 type II secretion system protein GspC [Shewanella gelidii]GGI89486.1 type II secretion system protein GspC [Shewanella gelidii]